MLYVFLFLVVLMSSSVRAFAMPSVFSIDDRSGNRSTTGSLSELKDFCRSSSITRVSLPVLPDRPSSRFEYGFQLIGTRDPSAPTIIVLPGGPGGSSMGPWGPALSVVFNLPTSNINVILTDPRGRSCNNLISARDETVSTTLIAGDVVGMISTLKLKNYILYGHSYGGQLATVAADLATRAEMPPRAVVLSATRGRHSIGEESPYDGFIREWERTKENLPANVVAQLSADSLPFGFSSEKWAAYIMNGLQEGTIFKNARPVNKMREQLLALETKDPAQLQELQTAVSASVVGGDPTSEYWRINRAVVCRESWEKNNGPMPEQLIKGQIVWFQNPLFCQGLKLDHAFDSKSFQLRVPVFYFHGSRDANVPLWQGQYHFENQRNTPIKRFVLIDEVSHGLAMGGLSECRDLIWKAIFDFGRGLNSAVSACGVPAQVF